MERNMGKWDRIIRLFLGLIILAVGYKNESLWGLIGIIPILTAIFARCPAYLPFHFSTCRK